MSALDKLAPYPRYVEAVTAEAVAKSLAVRAYLLNAELLADGNPGHAYDIDRLVNLYGVVALLRALIEIDSKYADDVARELWEDWEDGSVAGPQLHAWLGDWGIDGNQVAALSSLPDTKPAEPSSPTEEKE